MMGHHEKLRGGGEMDALTRAKSDHRFRPGSRAWIKAKHNRRVRRKAKSACVAE